MRTVLTYLRPPYNPPICVICVNHRAGDHAGSLSPEQLLEAVGPLGKPITCTGGVGDAARFRAMYKGLTLTTTDPARNTANRVSRTAGCWAA